MPALPRRVCSLCTRDVAVRRGGKLREHTDLEGEHCDGSGKLPTSDSTSPVDFDKKPRVELVNFRGIATGELGTVLEIGRPYARGGAGSCPVVVEVDGSDTQNCRGSQPALDLDVAAIRAATGLSMVEFAALLCVSKRTVVRWEAGAPVAGPAALLLHVLLAAQRNNVGGEQHPHAKPSLRFEGRELYPRRWARRDPVEVWGRLFAVAGPTAFRAG
jgi:DNA-binding transcriptional regulator YiaG